MVPPEKVRIRLNVSGVSLWAILCPHGRIRNFIRAFEGYDTLGTLKELAAQVRSATEDSENTAERVGRVFAGILDLLEQSGIEFDTAEGDDSIEILQSLSDQVRGATRKGENTSERVGRLFAGILNLGQ